jgi:putative DNA methylase
MMTKGVGAKTLSDIVDELHSIEASIDELDINIISDRLGWKSSFRDSVLKVLEQSLALTLELDSLGVQILVRGYPGYPSRLSRLLGPKAPPVLFAIGNLRLLESPSVGFSGSRNASERGLHIAREAATQLGKRGVNVVSGYAKGVDLNAHVAGLLSGGTTTIVLAEGITHFRAKSEIKRLLTADNYVVISEFLPLIPWAARQAMQRNQTIIGLTDAMMVVESGETGGTFACGESTLQLNHPLYVVEYASAPESAAGNSYFLKKGANPIRGDKSGQPNLSQLLNTVLGDGATTKASTPESKLMQAEIDPVSSPKEKSGDISSHETTPTYQQSEPQLTQAKYPKRLIEVDLPIARISAHARREKSIRHGHISTLHIWWARRPLAACRAVICASLWPDPADELCPQAFRDAAVELIKAFANRVFPKRISAEGHLLSSTKHSSPESLAKWEAIANESLVLNANEPASMLVLRMALLDFIADFANWDNSTNPAFLDTCRALTEAAHAALGGIAGTRPLVLDPFAGGGSIPIEALRVGADAFASDLNPVPILLNKVVLEYIPKYGQRLADEIRKWGKWVQQEAEVELEEYFPNDPDGAKPIAYLWARTIRCDGPGCGVTVPLIRSLYIAKQGKSLVALRLIPKPEEKRVAIGVITDAKTSEIGTGTVKRGSANCPCCGYTTPVARVREQLREQLGGADTSQLLVVALRSNEGKTYRTPTAADLENVAKAISKVTRGEILAPIELPLMSGVFNAPIYGIVRWDLLFSSRQLLAANEIGNAIANAALELSKVENREFALAVKVMLHLARGKYLDFRSTLCGWISVGEKIGHTFGRQALGMIFDWTEGVPFGDISGSWERSFEYIAEFVESESKSSSTSGTVESANAQAHPLPDDCVSAFITDPPYYNAVPYADLSDFFYVWMRKDLAQDFPILFNGSVAPKDDELCEMAGWDPIRYPHKNGAFYESGMRRAFAEGRRVCVPQGIGVVVFAHKTTAGWETLLSALIESGWTITGSWPIDTERSGRLRAMNSAALASSVHLICRPREDSSGRLTDEVGEWREVLGELPKRIHDWMPRLAAEGVVGADAIFACLGPALEIFSRYGRVEKSNGDSASLREYLEFVWGAVASEALALIFRDADASGLEPDARLTAMWLWTIGGGGVSGDGNEDSSNEEDNESEAENNDEDESGGKAKSKGGFSLEYDAARKIAQGLGIHLEQSQTLVEVSKSKARLLAVAERTQFLFGKNVSPSSSLRNSRKLKQKTLFEDLDEAEAAEEGWTTLKGPPPGSTTLDRVHQAMILFAANRGELLKRFLVDDGVGKDSRFWKLADNLNKLYPTGTDERRWVEGVLARKKGLGF